MEANNKNGNPISAELEHALTIQLDINDNLITTLMDVEKVHAMSRNNIKLLKSKVKQTSDGIASANKTLAKIVAKKTENIEEEFEAYVGLTDNLLQSMVEFEVNNRQMVQTATRLHNRVEEKSDELAAVEKNYNRLFDQVEQGLFLLGIDGSIEAVNGALSAATGFTKPELLSRNFAIDLVEEERQWDRLIDEVTRNGIANNFEMSLLNKRGSAFTVFLTLSNRVNHHNEVVGYQGVLQKTVLNKKTQSEFDNNDGLGKISNILSMYNHEMNQPLTLIYNYAQILETKSDRDDPNKKMYQLLLSESKRLVDIVKEIQRIKYSDYPQILDENSRTCP